MARPITSSDLPPDLARFAEAQVAAGRFARVDEVVRAGVDALRKNTEGEWLAQLRREAAEGFAAFDRGEGIEATADELMDGIDRELGLRS
jgi:putative addiction module CopG family antidote